jgi:hypothetical protein
VSEGIVAAGDGGGGELDGAAVPADGIEVEVAAGAQPRVDDKDALRAGDTSGGYSYGGRVEAGGAPGGVGDDAQVLGDELPELGWKRLGDAGDGELGVEAGRCLRLPTMARWSRASSRGSVRWRLPAIWRARVM